MERCDIQNGIKRKLSNKDMQAIFQSAFGQSVIEFRELTDGWANSAYLAVLQDRREIIVKVAPADGTSMMAYEQGLMATEVGALRLVKEIGVVPVPEVYVYDVSRSIVNSEYFIMEKLEGEPYNKVKESCSEQQRDAIEKQLGLYNRLLNEIKGERFGLYSAQEPAGTGWPETFRRLIEGVLEDGERANVELPVPYETVREKIALKLDSLKEVTEPRLVHWDLWDGNVFVKDGGITGIIDFERALWGDPLMEINFGRLSQTPSFLEGYGKKDGWSSGEKDRRALYDLYLDLILFIECPYRKYEDSERMNWARENLKQGWSCYFSS